MKNINPSSMDALLNGLTGNNSAAQAEDDNKNNQNETPRRGRKKSEVKMERICTIINAELMNKVRAIADKEHIAIKDIFTKGLTLLVNAYEEKHGTIRLRQTKKGDVESVFDL
ncbi:MAG: hypothetical protein IKH26_11730 [Bacteroidaceae bacterium]|nr:hypothetical protein [Bacteroidaceae bacterium]